MSATPLIKGFIQPFEVKDIDSKSGTFVQAYTRYNVKDSDNDYGRKGMFTKTWRENAPRIRHLLNHDVSRPIGNPQKFWDDSDYAYMESKIGDHNDGQDFIKMVESGLIKEASYGYTVIKANKLKDGSQELLEVKLWEVSSLTGWGANEYTPVISLQKGMTDDSVSEFLDRYFNMKSFVRNSSATDQAIQQIELEIKAMETLFSNLIKGTGAAPALQPPEVKESSINVKHILGFIELQKQLLTA